jgi:hypothetical protein
MKFKKETQLLIKFHLICLNNLKFVEHRNSNISFKIFVLLSLGICRLRQWCYSALPSYAPVPSKCPY